MYCTRKAGKPQVKPRTPWREYNQEIRQSGKFMTFHNWETIILFPIHTSQIRRGRLEIRTSMRRKEMSWFFEARKSGLIHGLCPHISLALASWSVALGLKLSLLLPLLSTVILPGASKGVQAKNSRTKWGTVVCPIAFHFLSRYSSDIPTHNSVLYTAWP